MKKFLGLGLILLFTACSNVNPDAQAKITEFGLKGIQLGFEIKTYKDSIVIATKAKQYEQAALYGLKVDSLVRLGFQYKDSIAFYTHQAKDASDSSTTVKSEDTTISK